jgi:hypothetical protein
MNMRSSCLPASLTCSLHVSIAGKIAGLSPHADLVIKLSSRVICTRTLCKHAYCSTRPGTRPNHSNLWTRGNLHMVLSTWYQAWSCTICGSCWVHLSTKDLLAQLSAALRLTL